MLNTILIVLAGLGLLIVGYFAVLHLDARTNKLHHEANLLVAQTNHIEQTAASEASLLEANIKAYEQQGVNKFRTAVSRLGGDLKKVEEQLGSKIKAVPHEIHDEAIATIAKLAAEIGFLKYPQGSVPIATPDSKAPPTVATA